MATKRGVIPETIWQSAVRFRNPKSYPRFENTSGRKVYLSQEASRYLDNLKGYEKQQLSKAIVRLSAVPAPIHGIFSRNHPAFLKACCAAIGPTDFFIKYWVTSTVVVISKIVPTVSSQGKNVEIFTDTEFGGQGSGAGAAGATDSDRVRRAKEMYKGVCKDSTCSNGVNTYGFNDSEKKKLERLFEELASNGQKYHSGGGKALVDAIKGARHPVVFAQSKTSHAIPVDPPSASNGSGSPVVVFINMNDGVTVLGNSSNPLISTIGNHWITLPPSGVLGHELFHAQKMLRGVYDSSQNVRPGQFGTHVAAEINAIKYMNSIRLDYVRTEY